LTVTSYNGKERTYHYSLSRTLIVGEGDVLLETAEDVEAFAARGISRIEGNLIIGKETGSVKEDSLLSFAALSGVKEVSGTVLINPTYKFEFITSEQLFIIHYNNSFFIFNYP
jgi:hypothetical protein